MDDCQSLLGYRAIDKALALPVRSKLSNKFTSAIERNTISLTTLTAGVGSPPEVNVIPSVSEATLDCRLPGTNSDESLSEIKARINDPRVTVEAIYRAPDRGMSRSDTLLFASMRTAMLQKRGVIIHILFDVLASNF